MGSCKDDRVQVRWYCHHHHHKPAGIWLPWSVHAQMGAEVVFRESIRTISSHLVNNFPFGHKNHICKRWLNSCLTTSFWWRVEVRLRVRRVVLTVEVKLTSPPPGNPCGPLCCVRWGVYKRHVVTMDDLLRDAHVQTALAKPQNWELSVTWRHLRCNTMCLCYKAKRSKKKPWLSKCASAH